MDTLFKTFLADIKSLPDSRTIKFLISTDGVDRDGDTISPKGWKTETYQKNPVVLWAHDYSALPVAKTIALAATEHGLEATAEFPAKGVYPFADTVFDMLKGGFLGAASVGFKATSHEKATDRDHGYNYKEQELLEFSVVPIPANPEALVQMSMAYPEKKEFLKPLVNWSEKLLGEYYGERGVWLPASQIEKTFDLITTKGLLLPDRKVEAKAEEDDIVIEIEEDLVTVDLEEVKALAADQAKKMIQESIEQAVRKAVEYATGRVS